MPKLSKNQTLVIVIDMLNGFAKTGALADSKINEIIPNIKNLLDSYENNLFIADAHLESDFEMRLYPNHCLAGTPEAQIVPELAHYAKEIVTKQTTNAIWSVDLPKITKYPEIIITGCCTDICILQFVLSLQTYLFNNKINCNLVVYKNSVTTFDRPGHNAEEFHNYALALMKNAGVEIR